MVDSRISVAYLQRMTLEERLKLAREIAARSPVRVVICNAREEARQLRWDKAKAQSKKRPS